MVPVRRRFRAALATLVAALVVPGLAVTATAATTESGNIDPDETGRLTVTARARVADGAEGVTLAGVEFTAQRVTQLNGKLVDLTTPAGWEAIEGITAADITPSSAVLETPGVKKQTGTDGKAVFENLALGLYYVTETGSLDNVAAQTMPFLVTLPRPDANAAGGWRYAVEAEPKSSTVSASKVADDTSAIKVGDRVRWTLTGSVPQAGTAGQPLTRYVITDTLDERLGYDASTIPSIRTQPIDAGLIPGTDFTGGFNTGRTATIDFTASGLAKLATIAGPAATLSVSVDTTVLSIGDGTIENTATFEIGEARLAAEDVTEWGALTIYKHTAGEENRPLEGATFQAFLTAEDAANKTNPIFGTTTFTTGSDGTVVLPGLRSGTKVYLVETEAPAGYVAAGTIDPIVIQTGANRVEIANARRGALPLPELGAAGMAIAGVLGLGLMGGGAGLAVASKRRKARAHS